MRKSEGESEGEGEGESGGVYSAERVWRGGVGLEGGGRRDDYWQD